MRKAVFWMGMLIGVIVGLFLWLKSGNSNPVGEKAGEVAGGKTLKIFCAAGIKQPIERLLGEYEREYGVKVELMFGGSGTLLSQAILARDGDLFLAADESYLQIGREKGVVREILPLAKMEPVLAVAKGNPKAIQKETDLLREDVRVALANPEAAAIGKTAKALLEKSGIWEQVERGAKVMKPTVTEVANDIKLGAVDVGILWDATVFQYPEIEAVPVQGWEEGTQKIAIGVLSSCRQPQAALKLARYLSSRDRGGPVFQELGYGGVNGDVWVENPVVDLFSGGVNRMAIQDTLRHFEEREGVTVRTIYNGCGILVAQMKAGEKPDAYFACDVSFMNSVQDSFFPSISLAKTRMLMLVQKGNPLNILSLNDLTRSGVRLGVANPDQSALGDLTRRLMSEVGVWESAQAQIRVQTPTADLLVNQMRSGALDVAVVYEANTSQVRDVLDLVPIDHPKAMAIQPYAVSKGSTHPYLMARLLEALKEKGSVEVFEEVGFQWIGEGGLGWDK